MEHLLLEVPYFRKQFCARAPLDGGGPANKVRSWAKEGKDFAISGRAWLEAAFHAPAPGAARMECRRRRSDPVRVLPILLSEFPACGPSVSAARQSLGRQIEL